MSEPTTRRELGEIPIDKESYEQWEKGRAADAADYLTRGVRWTTECGIPSRELDPEKGGE